MKQFLLFVSLAGAALYALLVFTHDAITDAKSERIPVPISQLVHPVPQRLSSWESYLRSSGPNSQTTAHMPPQQNIPATSEAKSVVSTAAQVEWTKVVLAARMYDQASVTSHTVKHYSPGTNLQVVRREGVWLLVSDPVSRENGWILQEYLSPSESLRPTQAARESTVAIAAPQKSKKSSQSAKRSKSATRASKRRSAVARWDPYRWGSRADRRHGFRVFMLGPSFARR
jgi:hypothetical protein